MSEGVLRPRLGVIGGLGPLATADFYRKLTELTPASCDADHIPAVLLSLPQIPDRSGAILARSDAPFAPLAAAVDMLVGMGVEFIAIPCNSAHHWHERLAARTSARILHIVDASVRMLEQVGASHRVAVMATSGTLASGFYQRRLAVAGRVFVNPAAARFQKLVDQTIQCVKAGALEEARNSLEAACSLCVAEGVDAILFACTELPVAAEGVLFPGVALVDSTAALAQSCVDCAWSERASGGRSLQA